MLRRDPIPHNIWHDVTRSTFVLRGLDAVQMAHLRELTTWFINRKAIAGAQGLEVTPSMRVTVAAQACLLILNLGVEYFDGWWKSYFIRVHSASSAKKRIVTGWFIVQQVF